MLSIDAVLIVASFVCFLLVAVNVSGGKVNLLGAGLACWVATLLF